MKVQQQGEVRIEKIDDLPDGLNPFTETNAKGSYIISHSEKGHHHVIDADNVQVLERPLSPEFGKGMRILYAIVSEPTVMYQDANVPHEPAQMPAGVYELTISVETDPFTKQARRVAD